MQTTPTDFIQSFKDTQKLVFGINVKNGFWGDDVNNLKERNVGELIALMHSELSEALEAHRNGNPPDDKIPQFSGLEAELADVVIRIMDAAEGLNLRVAEAIIQKLSVNAARPYKHGKEY